MSSKHPSQPAASLEDKVDETLKEAGSANKPAPRDLPLDEEEKPTEPARRRAPKYLRVLLPDVRAELKANDHGS